MAGSEDFYRDLPDAKSFAQVGQLQYYQPVPDDWCVLAGDIRASTEAIAAGNYKAVNMIGAAVITAVLNACPDYDLPFVFGGDGGAVVVPSSARAAGVDALARLKAHARAMFDLDLRAGAVTVAALRAGGHDLRLMKLALSDSNSLAMFCGGGLAAADAWLKRAGEHDPIHIDAAKDDALPTLDGLSCRWQPLESQNGMMMSIITASTDHSVVGEREHFHSVTSELTAILGAPFELSSPVTDQTLRFKWPPAGFGMEVRATRGRKSQLRRALEIVTQTMIQGTIEHFNGRAGYYDARKYREEIRHNTDFQKYDDMLRLVLDVTVEQAARIDAYLHSQFMAGQLNYGIHTSRNALMTCVVFSLKDSRHVHFIDGADGGFTVAAMNLKRQVAGLPPLARVS